MTSAEMRILIRVLGGRAAAGEIQQITRATEGLTNSQKKNAAAGLSMAGAYGALGRLEKFGKDLQWTGRQIEYRLTLPLIAAGVASGKFAMDNERAFTRLRKVYGTFAGDTRDVNKELSLLRRGFEELSNIFGVNQAEVIQIGADWAQAGAQGIVLAKATRLTLETNHSSARWQTVPRDAALPEGRRPLSMYSAFHRAGQLSYTRADEALMVLGINSPLLFACRRREGDGIGAKVEWL